MKLVGFARHVMRHNRPFPYCLCRHLRLVRSPLMEKEFLAAETRIHRKTGNRRGGPMRLISIASALFALAMPVTAVGQNDLQAQLKGHSIVMRYTEVVQGRRRTARIVWNQEIYISSRGRLFVRVNAEGKGRTARHEIAPGSENSGGATPFRWTENGLARGWRDRRGRMVRQTIEISRSGMGFTCRATITRSAFASGSDHQICRVVVGNPLGGK